MSAFKLSEESKKRMEALAEAADRMDYSSCSDSGVVMGFRKGYLAGMQDPEANVQLLEECEDVLLTAWGNLEAGSLASQRVDAMIEKLRERGKG